MRLDVGLIQAQVQKQILSPQMIQSMEILVLNSQQLEERIEQALEDNIALEVTDAEGEATGEEAAAEGSEGAPLAEPAAAPPAPDSEREIDLLQDRYEHLAEFQVEDFYASRQPRSFAEGDEDDRFEALQNAPDRPESLAEHLIAQIRLRSGITDRERQLAT